MGQQSFTYTISDGQLHDSARVTVTVGDAKVDPISGSLQPPTYTDKDGCFATILIPTGAISDDNRSKHDPTFRNSSPRGRLAMTMWSFYTSIWSRWTVRRAASLIFGQRVFEINAYLNGILQDDYRFKQPITITLTYRDTDVTGLDEASLRVYFFDEVAGTWVEITTIIARDLEANRIVFTIDHLTHFALFAPQMVVTRPNLTLSKSVVRASNLSQVPPDSVLTYTLTLSNSGTGDALGVALTDTLPAGLTFGGWVVQDVAQASNGELTWQGLISAQRMLNLIYTVTVNSTAAGQSLTNTVRATADNVTAVNDASVSIQVAAQPHSDQIFLPLVLK